SAAVEDACIDSPPAWRKYDGPLRNVRCEQEQFLTMAGIADDLGVKCGYCHLPKPDGKTFDYPPMTPHKEVAMWMDQTFMRALKRADGQPMMCSACHVDKNGKPAAKFLGEPRDIAWTVEWMTTVMTNRFVLENGEKLKCKHCHGATWGSKDFKKEVIGKTEQVPHVALPPSDPAPSASASASAAPSTAPAATVAAPPSASAPPPKKP
ncbi:MAG: hypothetical protein JNK04_02390, partial [Myxococcales bacterium]|nr:hypothetical protein [Myxococcales bacterium]